jgi:uncharacterized protein YggE
MSWRTAVLSLAAWLMPAVAASAQTPAPAGPVPAIVTQGEAVLKRAPDQAFLTVATEQRETQPGEARRKGAEAMTAVQAALKAAGVPADAIRTTAYSLTPDVEWVGGRSTIRGYVARNQIEVRVDNLDRLAAVIDAANTPRTAGLSIIGPRFDLKSRQAVENEALQHAVQAAMERARAIAAGARRTLGPIVRIEAHPVDGVPRPMPMAERMMAARQDTPTPITPGEIEIRAAVTLTVEIR